MPSSPRTRTTGSVSRPPAAGGAGIPPRFRAALHSSVLRRASTLLGSLAVFAISAVLAARLLPVFAQAREKARQASCMSNVRQIGLAALQYAQDYDEHLMGTELGQEPEYFWSEMLQPYLKNRPILQCPSASEKFQFSSPLPG